MKVQAAAMESPELAIRLQRAAFNRALADADVDAIAPILAPAALLLAETDSAVLSGRKAQLQAWKHEFAAKDRVIYTRQCDRVEVSPAAPIALEHGHWQGVTAAGHFIASGSYSAKWRRIGQDWVIEAEIFVTLA